MILFMRDYDEMLSTLTCDNPSGLWRPMFVARSHLVIYLESQRKVLDAVLGDVAEDTWLRALINFYPFASVGETLIEGCETKWYLDPTQASSRLDVLSRDRTIPEFLQWSFWSRWFRYCFFNAAKVIPTYAYRYFGWILNPKWWTKPYKNDGL